MVIPPKKNVFLVHLVFDIYIFYEFIKSNLFHEKEHKASLFSIRQALIYSKLEYNILYEAKINTWLLTSLLHHFKGYKYRRQILNLVYVVAQSKPEALDMLGKQFTSRAIFLTCRQNSYDKKSKNFNSNRSVGITNPRYPEDRWNCEKHNSQSLSKVLE